MAKVEVEQIDETPEIDEAVLDQEVKGALEEVEEAPVEEPSYTEAEQKAMDMGWNPDPAALEGTGKQWIPADEFLRNQTFFSEIKSLKKQVKQQQKVTEAFKEQNKIVYDRAYQKAYEDLRKQKIAAAEERDLGKMLEIDDQIDSLNKTKEEEVTNLQALEIKQTWDDAFEDFVEQNSWYQEDEVKRTYADTIGWKYAQSTPGVTPEEVYTFVKTEVQKKFNASPEKVSTPKARVSPVAAPTRSPVRGKGSKTMADVPEEHRAIGMTLIRAGELSEADYLKQYFAE